MQDRRIETIEYILEWYTKKAYFPKELYIKIRILTSEDIMAIGVLEELFQASIKIKNPVVIV